MTHWFRYALFVTLCCVITVIGGVPSGSVAQTFGFRVESLNFAKETTSGSEVLRLLINLNQKPRFSTHYLPKPSTQAVPARYYIDLEDTHIERSLKLPDIPDQSPVVGIRVAQNTPDKVRIVLDLADDFPNSGLKTSFTQQAIIIEMILDPISMAIAQLTTETAGIETVLAQEEHKASPTPAPSSPATEREESLEAATSSGESANPIPIPSSKPQSKKVVSASKTPIPAKANSSKQRFRIVLDPGHGGQDPGARGPMGTNEKDITLILAKKLRSLLLKENFEVFMTREADVTMSLADRTAFANRMKGDVFVSVHTNASPKRSAAGVSTYFLHNADDQESLRVAMRENGELAMPDVSKEPVPDEYFLEVMKASMVKNFHTTQSTDLARQVQRAMMDRLSRQYQGVNNLGVRSARFFVLTGVNMPAVLVETSFISNRTEEKRLRQNSYQDVLARSMLQGIQSFVKSLQSSAHTAMYAY